jgi:D-glycerate 3-kinase
VSHPTEVNPIVSTWQQFRRDGDVMALRAGLWANFGLNAVWDKPDADAAAVFDRRWQWLQLALPQLELFFNHRQFDPDWILPLWQVWLPLAGQLQDWASGMTAPPIIGFLGGQGSGKTTLTTLLKLLLELQGLRVLAWSLDDLYLPYADRLALQAQDPRLVWRGPPGTHDVALGRQILRQLQAGGRSAIPRFDKSAEGGKGDRAGFETVGPVDLVLFEGWCVGARPLSPMVFAAATTLPEPIRTAADRAFARDMNQALHEYLPLWAMLDRLVVLQLQDYRWSLVWRQQAERQMRAIGGTGLDDRAIAAFVEYFWTALHPELFVTPLTREPGWVDLVLEIGADHWPARVRRPGGFPSGGCAND